MLELKRHREKLLKNTATLAHPQRTITTFFSPTTPTNATSQSRHTQMGPRLGHKKGVTIDRAIAIFRARRPWPHGPRPQHPKQLFPTIAGASLASETFPFWIDLC